MENRVTQLVLMVEYEPLPVLFATQAVLMVEYEPLPVLFATQAVLMVEYGDDDLLTQFRIFGPASQ